MTHDEKQLAALDVIFTVSEIADHDIDLGDSYAVEQFLRERNPKVSKRFVTECIKAARERRDRNSLHGLFEIINNSVKAWPAKPDAEIVENIVSLVGEDFDRLACEQDATAYISHRNIAVRCAALLLIEQAAWRRHHDELNASFEEYEERHQ